MGKLRSRCIAFRDLSIESVHPMNAVVRAMKQSSSLRPGVFLFTTIIYQNKYLSQIDLEAETVEMGKLKNEDLKLLNERFKWGILIDHR